ncbi:hypothetical protein DSO57_1015930 [Entomophthora muscae]|uniref:Uncharacterized protein n=3 Tax=Entomophthora muscae TaxID=34485 RepID=A0ACC2TS04_9FUNG|nr:hypothetical protein DSO57_1015930 [Entomophthora muscae]
MASTSEKVSLSSDERDILEFLNSSFSSLESLEINLSSVLSSHSTTFSDIDEQFQKERLYAKIKIEKIQQKCRESSKELNELKESYPSLQKEIAAFSDEPEWSKKLALEYQMAERSDAALSFLYFSRKALGICARAEADAKSTTTAQLESYHQLVDCVNFLRCQAESPRYTKFYSLQLQEHLETKVLRINLHMQKSLTKHFERTLDSMGWPQEVDLHQLAQNSPEVLKNFRTQYSELAKFQKLSNDVNPIMDKITTNSLPLDIMVKTILIRFYYHFMGPRPTNSLEHPEWFLSYILDMLTSHMDLMGHLQAQQPFMSAMAQIVKLKVNSVRGASSRPPHLPRFIKELVEFDHSVSISAPLLHWEGCAGLLLRNDECFNIWLSEEQRVVEHRLDEIFQSPDVWEHVNTIEGCAESDRPTVAADRVASLFEATLSRYVHLRPAHLQIRYFAQVHLSLVQGFHQEMVRCTNRYEKRITGFRLPGAPRVEYFPYSAVTQMIGVIDSIHFFVALLEDYDTQPFFLVLWDTIKLSTSGSGLFDELIAAFSMLSKKITLLLGDGLAREFSRDLRPWTILNPWTEGHSSSEIELRTAVDTLSTHLRLTTQLHPDFQKAALRRFAAKIEEKLLKLIPEDIPPKILRDVCIILDGISPFYDNPISLFPRYAI